MDPLEITNLCYQALDEIKQSSHYLLVKKNSEALYENQVANELMKQFVIYKEKYQDVCKYGKHHPDYKNVVQQFSSAKATLYTNEFYIQYKIALNELNKVLENFSQELKDILKPCLIGSEPSCEKR